MRQKQNERKKGKDRKNQKKVTQKKFEEKNPQTCQHKEEIKWNNDCTKKIQVFGCNKKGEEREKCGDEV